MDWLSRIRAWWTRRRIVVAAAVLTLIFAPPTIFATALLISYTGSIANHAHTRGRDALWIGHAWVDGRRTTAEIASLAQRLRTTGIRYVYVHIGPLNDDGSRNASRHPRAATFLHSLGRFAPEIEAQAWLGNVVGGDHLDLGSPATRDNIVRSTQQALDLGFDGIHLDLEPIATGDGDFLTLLDGVKAATNARGAPLSVAAEAVEPAPGLAWFATTMIRPQWWTPGYLRQVATRVDQVAVMAYDTALPSERLYGGFVRRQAEVALNVVPPRVHLLIGVPAFHTNDLFHRSRAETVQAALRGVRLAISNEADRKNFGVALYVDFAATEEDWRDYIASWVTPRRIAN